MVLKIFFCVVLGFWGYGGLISNPQDNPRRLNFTMSLIVDRCLLIGLRTPPMPNLVKLSSGVLVAAFRAFALATFDVIAPSGF